MNDGRLSHNSLMENFNRFSLLQCLGVVKKFLGTLYQNFQKKVFAELRFYVIHVSMKTFCYDKLSNLSHTHCLFFILYNFYEFKGLCFKTRISKACVLNSHVQHTLVFEQRRASYLLLTPATLHKLNIPFNQVM